MSTAPSRACSASRLCGALRKDAAGPSDADRDGAGRVRWRDWVIAQAIADSVLGVAEDFAVKPDHPCFAHQSEKTAWRRIARTLRLLLACQTRTAVDCILRQQTLLVVPDVVARDRQRADAFGELELEHDETLVAEGRLRAGEVELPHAAKPFIEDRRRLVPVGQKALAPRAQGLGIVQAQDFDVGDDQLRPLDRRDHLGKGGNIAAGEDVFGDEGIGYRWRL